MPAKPESIAAVICAAGSSNRFGTGLKKEYAMLYPSRNDSRGKPLSVLGAAVLAFSRNTNIGTIVITTPAGDENGIAAQSLPEELLNDGKIFFIPGGNSRRESVHKALIYLKAFSPEYVLIHDAARPWISGELIDRVINAMRINKAAIPVIPAHDTPKVLESSTEKTLMKNDTILIKSHPKRGDITFAQTPQGFSFNEILAAHEKAATNIIHRNAEFTDDAEIWNEFNGPVTAVPGEMENRKITYAEDLQ